MPQGSFGELKVFEDFLAPDDDHSWVAGGGLLGNISYVSVNEGSFEWTVDEPGGILAATTDVGDNDNIVLKIGTFVPADGGMQMEARFKLDNVTTLSSLFVGFTETLALDTPVMPAEFATATMTINGTGGMAGMQFDIDGTVDDFRAVVADAGAMLAGIGAQGTRANATIAANTWYIVRVEIHPDGMAEVYLGDGTNNEPGLRLIDRSTAALDTAANYYAVVMAENRTAGAIVLETDYMYARGWRDWRV
jgi:hypothetical protein